MNEIDLWSESEDLLEENGQYLQDIGHELLKLFAWSDYPTSEENFDEIYNRIWNGEKLNNILKEKLEGYNVNAD